ncbi:MAG: radical SAM protein [Desulfobulbaceae bacterium]|jgi:putative pyruvate formate lyase activating enzyme|nr:radical SAM protein [Desulfobulbaceae bacterium]MDY0352245.1 radical SAM protein [Desulfobulbaceae bacterium]
MSKNKNNPSYLELHRNGILAERLTAARGLLERCAVCPHECGINRLAGELGVCRVGARARVASFGPHFGEESPLVGRHGSGTIFFEGCNLLCVFCQNYDISNIDKQGDSSPQAVDEAELADIMISLQAQGCHNINLVTPSHVVPQILAALPAAIDKGLRIPIVYNSGGYDSPAALSLLEGVVDIYMPDCKFWTRETSSLYTRAADYPEVMRQAVREMHRQVGDLVLDEEGIAVRGLLVRHLVMPGHLDETGEILTFLARDISPRTYVNLMDQYHPCHKAFRYEKIKRPLSADEYEQALSLARECGLSRLDQREWKRFFRLLGL